MAQFNPGDEERVRNPIAWLRRFLRTFGIEAFAKRYYAIYWGEVVDNADPLGLYRIRATCPAVGIVDAAAVPPDWWAWPNLPGLGNDADGKSGGEVWVPDVGSKVWMQFEHGLAEHPVYGGGHVSQAKQMPELDHAAALRKGMRTRSGHFLRMSDDPTDLHIMIAKGDGAGSQTPTFLTFDKKGNVTISNDTGSLIHMDAENTAVSVINSSLSGTTATTESMVTLGKDEVSLVTKGGATLGMKGADITLNGRNIVINGVMVNLASLQVYLGKNAKEPAVRGMKWMMAHMTHVHTAVAPGAPTTPPTGKPPMLGMELSNTVFIS